MSVRVYKATVAEAPASPKLRAYKATVNGTSVVTPQLRVYKATMSGTAAVLIAVIPNQLNVEPETLITVTTSVTSGHTADAWTWRRISGPNVTLSGTGGTRTFYAPSGMPPAGATLVLGVTATASGVTSPEQTVTVTVLPQLSWQYSAGSWIGNRPPVSVS